MLTQRSFSTTQHLLHKLIKSKRVCDPSCTALIWGRIKNLHSTILTEWMKANVLAIQQSVLFYPPKIKYKFPRWMQHSSDLQQWPYCVLKINLRRNLEVDLRCGAELTKEGGMKTKGRRWVKVKGRMEHTRRQAWRNRETHEMYRQTETNTTDK